MIKYIHGSHDSLDVDTYYVFNKLPSKQECKEFCDNIKDENANIIVIKNGIVTDCYKGTNDEVNNGLVDTYSLHEQEYPLLITKRINRDILMKCLRATRGILSYLTRTEYRPIIKKALNGNWKDRIDCLNQIDFSSIDFDSLQKTFNKKDILKVFSFQIGQTLGLLNGIELYTKQDIANYYPLLKEYLYRESDSTKNLLKMLDIFIDKMNEIKYNVINETTTYFIDYDKKVNIKYERYED